MDKVLNKLTLYLLKKSATERLILFILFLVSLIVITSYMDDDSEWMILQKQNFEPTHTNANIKKLFDFYNIKTKCLKIICTSQEIKQIIKLPKNAVSNVESKSVYTIYFECDDISCYEFIRELEKQPKVFINKAETFDIAILHDDSDSTNDIQIYTEDNKNNSQTKWRQTILISFEINNGSAK